MSGDRIVSVTPAARVARGRRRRDEGNQRDVISDAPRCTFVRSARADAHAVLTVDLDIFALGTMLPFGFEFPHLYFSVLLLLLTLGEVQAVQYTLTS